MENVDIDKTLVSRIASSDITNPVFNSIKKCEYHLSMKKLNISWAVKIYSSCLLLKQKILVEIHNLVNKIIKGNSDIFFLNLFFITSINLYLMWLFSSELKIADAIPVFKKNDWSNNENYRPLSILLNFLKIYWRCFYNQMYKYFNHILSKWQCGFRKVFI